MKNTRFSVRLYADMLRHLRLAGGMMLAVALVITLLPPLLQGLSGGPGAPPSRLAITPALAPFMYLGAITLVFTAFSHLFSRRASDFYHALPETRLSLYIACAAAALTWILGTVAVTTLAAFGAHGIFGVMPAAGDFFPNIFGYGTGALLVAGCALVGVCAAGTRFSAFILTCILLFLPRYISILFSAIMESVAPMLIPGALGPFFDVSLNFPVFFIVGGATGSRYGAAATIDEMFATPATLLYTFVLALLYICAAAALFYFRKSETAGRSAPGRVAQHIYSGLVASPTLVLWGCATAVFMAGNHSSILGGGDFVSLSVILAALTLTVYCVYVLITTKKLRNLKKAFIVLPLTCAVCFGLAFGASAIWEAEMKLLPAAEEIESFSFRLNRQRGTPAYREIAESEAPLSDARLRDIISESMRLTYESRRGDASAYGTYEGGEWHSFDIKLTDGKSVSRSVWIPARLAGDFHALCAEDDAFAAASAGFPEDVEITSAAITGTGYYALSEYDLHAQYGVLSIFREEYAALPQKTRSMLSETQYSSVLYGGRYYVTETAQYAATPPAAGVEEAEKYGVPIYREEGGAARLSSLRLWIIGRRNGVIFSSEYALTGYTPEAANMAMSLINFTNGGVDGVQEFKRVFENAEGRIRELHLDILGVYNIPREGELYYAGGGDSNNAYYLNSMAWGADKTRDIAALLLESASHEPDITRPLIEFDAGCEFTNENGYSEWRNAAAYVNVDEDDLDALLRLIADAYRP